MSEARVHLNDASPAVRPREAAGAVHRHDLTPFRHSHAFADGATAARMRALWWVTAITLATMALELVAGYWSGSLALVADGWHMGTHAAALGGAALAYRLSRRAEGHSRYAFGGWKIEVLAGYSSGLLLLLVALMLVADAIAALISPRAIDFQDALVVAVVGLIVNLASAALLARAGGDAGHGHAHAHAHTHAHAPTGHAQDHEHPHEPRHGHEHAPALAPQAHAHTHPHPHPEPHSHAHPSHGHDHNFRAAYLHVLADALTSLLAIAALAGGLWWGWAWLDPLVALVGAAVIGTWAVGLLRTSARALVDATADDPLRAGVRAAIESDGDATLADLHVWQVGPRAWSAALSVVADRPLGSEVYRARLAALTHIRHVTIEVHRCQGEARH